MLNLNQFSSNVLFLLWGMLLLFLVGCATIPNSVEGQNPRELTVFAAASLAEAFAEVGDSFEAENPGVSVAFNFAGSQQLRTQLEHGARADVFASADMKQMDAVIATSLTLDAPTNFATNRLVIIAPVNSKPGFPQGGAADTPANDGLQFLAQPGLKLVLASPEAPVGAYSRQMLERAGADPRFDQEYLSLVLANVVSEETNVRNVAQKVALGEADAGIVYQTDAMAKYAAGRVRAIPIPEPFNITASYPVAPLKETRQPELARKFVRFLTSDQSQEILLRHGFEKP